MKGKTVFALAALTVYIVCPAYRYYIIGVWVAHRIMNDKPKFIPISKGSKEYKRLVGTTA